MKNKIKEYNRIGSWVCFGISAFTYLKTMEASGSWWDCGEFMSAAYKLEVVHEPGSPLFLMLGKIFSLLALHPNRVYSLINAMSALASAGTILFLFWTISAFAEKIVLKSPSISSKISPLLITGSGIIGALAYTFSDTFWFSAVESEVYALSSFFTALVFWAILRWEKEVDERPERADRWLIFIAFSMGLSIGVHLLNLLTIPALVFVYYYKKVKPSTKGFLLASLTAIILLATILFGIIPQTLKIASRLDIYFVNNWSWPFNLAALGFLISLFISIGLGLWLSRKRKFPVLHRIFLGLFFLLLGYTSYLMVILRAQADPPLNNSNPNNINSLNGYLAREQYEESPVIWGPDFSSEITGVSKGEMEYRKGENQYEEKGPKLSYTYAPEDTHFLPRLWSREKAGEYKVWLSNLNSKPSFWDNINFLFSYQFDFMYFRYFMWNFTGRQNDTPSGSPNTTQGNWLSGIGFIDALRLGNQSALPSSLTENKAYNRLYFLPLLLGLIGLIFQIRKNSAGAVVLGLLFLFTGLAIAFYLNMPPGQPRERDYAFAGSFYAFSIWIGLGLIPLYTSIQKIIKSDASLWISFLLTLSIPILMAFTEWDDHDRSNRTVVKDFAANYLNSCAPNAILFTSGDNETYPLWYAQEVEGIRTDVRVVNLNLLEADWCIDKLKKGYNQSPPLPISWDHQSYKDGVRDYLSIRDSAGNVSTLQDQLNFVLSKNPKDFDENGDNYFPGNKISVPVNPEEVIQSGTVQSHEKKKILPFLKWTFPRKNITKGQLIILDIINQNHWRRPIYFCSTSGPEVLMGLDPFLRQDGITLRLVPIEKDTTQGLSYPINLDLLYGNVMNRFKWGNMTGNIHIDDQTNSFADSFKDVFMELAIYLEEHHKIDSCLKVLDREEEVLPEKLPPLSGQLGPEEFRIVHKAYLYLQCQAPKKALPLLERQLNRIQEEVKFVASQGKEEVIYYAQTYKSALSLLKEMKKMSLENHIDSLLPRINLLENAIRPLFSESIPPQRP